MLSDRKVERITEPGRHRDGTVPGLYLNVSQNGAKSWIFRFEMAGHATMMGLGSVSAFDLRQARERARECRRLLADGTNPLKAKHAKHSAAKAAAAKQISFREAATAYAAANEIRWTNAGYRAQFMSSLARYALPAIGDVVVSEINTPLVLKVVEPIWKTKTETASRVLSRIAKVLDYAAVKGLRAGDNPARWEDHLDQVLPAPGTVTPVKHFTALPYADIGVFMQNLRKVDGNAARALEFLVLTATRTGEVRGARWSEIDGSMWTIPGARTKTKKELRVPLAPAALDILAKLPRTGEFIFAGERTQQIGRNQMSKLLERLRPGLTVHGFRSCFRDWAGETTAYAREIAEQALGHTVGNAVERAYARGDLFDKRARLMADWARYCAAPPAAGAGDVVSIRSRKTVRGRRG